MNRREGQKDIDRSISPVSNHPKEKEKKRKPEKESEG